MAGKDCPVGQGGSCPAGRPREPSMPISDVPIFSMLRTKMQWHQERQKLLAENVANADTPNFKPRDLAPLKFDGNRTPPAGGVALATTDPAHIAISTAGATSFQQDRKARYEIRPAGNA